MAKRIGFDAYGTTKDMPDPIANAIDSLLDHIHSMETQIEAMQKAMQEHGIAIPKDGDRSAETHLPPETHLL
jgi:serine O-acetyltransferase